jgi:hypothetical protein
VPYDPAQAVTFLLFAAKKWAETWLSGTANLTLLHGHERFERLRSAGVDHA